MPLITITTFDMTGQKAAEVRADAGTPFRVSVGGTLIEVKEPEPRVESVLALDARKPRRKR